MDTIAFIEEKYGNQKRANGAFTTTHLYAVRDILDREGIKDEDILDAALLHDMIEDFPEISREELSKNFGKKVAEIVELVSKDPDWNTPYCKMKSNLDAMEHIAWECPEAILIKMADRLHNLWTLDGFSLEKQREYLEETKELLIPMFERILHQEENKKIKKYMQSLLQKLIQEVHEQEKKSKETKERVSREKKSKETKERALQEKPDTSLHNKKPGIMIYEGWAGIEKVYLEVLKEAQKNGEKILAFESGTDIEKLNNEFVSQYIQERIEKKIIAYVITPNDQEDRAYQKMYEGKYTFIRLLPEFPLGANINIVGDLVMSFTVHPPQGTIRRDKEEAKSQKAIFWKLWKSNFNHSLFILNKL